MAWTGRTAIGQPGTCLAPIPYHPCDNGEPRAPWERGRLARIRAILRVPGCAGIPNREPGTRNREPHASWVRGRPRPHMRNPERPWVRGRLARIRAILSVPGCAGVSPAYAQSCASLGARASRPHTRNPARAGCAGVSPAYAQSCACRVRGRPARIRAILRVPGCAGVSPAYAQSCASLGARASRPHVQSSALAVVS